MQCLGSNGAPAHPTYLRQCKSSGLLLITTFRGLASPNEFGAVMKPYVSFALMLALTACLTLAPRTFATSSPVQAPTMARVAAPASPACANTYLVRPGDTLRSIAQRCHVRAARIRQLNRVQGELVPGQRLVLRIAFAESSRNRTSATLRRPEPTAAVSELHPRVLPTPKPLP